MTTVLMNPESPTWGEAQSMAEDVLEALGGPKGAADKLPGRSFMTLAKIAALEPDETVAAKSHGVAWYDLCKHCDHFVDEDGLHLYDEEHHNPDDHHKAEPRGEPRTLEHWQDIRPDLFFTYGDGLVGPNSQFHPTTCDWSKKPE